MERDASPSTADHSAHTGAIGTLVAVYWVVDAYVFGVSIVIISAWVNPLIVFGVAAVVLTFTNLACCTWLDHEWQDWAAGHGKRVEAKLEKMRKSRLLKHPVEWITHGSAGWFMLAAALTNAITAVAVARVVGGQPVGARRVRLASLAYAVFFAALFSIIGYAAGDVIRAA